MGNGSGEQAAVLDKAALDQEYLSFMAELGEGNDASGQAKTENRKAAANQTQSSDAPEVSVESAPAVVPLVETALAVSSQEATPAQAVVPANVTVPVAAAVPGQWPPVTSLPGFAPTHMPPGAGFPYFPQSGVPGMPIMPPLPGLMPSYSHMMPAQAVPVGYAPHLMPPPPGVWPPRPQL